METKPTTFDCVEMKRKSQEAMLAEFETRRNEFTTFTEFVDAKARESEWVAAIWDKFGGKST